jgi:hypothetical protein
MLCLHLAHPRVALQAQMTIFAKFNHGRCGSNIKALGRFANFVRKSRPAPQTLVALPAKAKMAAMAGNAACHGLTLKHDDIANAQISQAAHSAQAGGAATYDDYVMAFHRSAPW